MIRKIIISTAFLAFGASAEQLFEEKTDKKEVGGTGRCNVLALGGGGTKGAYEVGAVNHLYRTLKAPDNYYDVFSGVSVGSLNAFGYGCFANGDEEKAAVFMETSWKNLRTNNIW